MNSADLTRVNADIRGAYFAGTFGLSSMPSC